MSAIRKDFIVLLKVNGMNPYMWNEFSSLFMKSSINVNDRKFYENCLNIISNIRIKYGLKGIQVKEIEELFSGVKYIEFKEQMPREIYNKNKKGAIL